MFAPRLGLLAAFLLQACGPTPLPAEDLKTKTSDTDAGDTAPKPVTAPPSKPVLSPPTPKAISRQDALVKTFASYVGIKEEPLGSNQGKMVNKFNASCGLDPSERAPWCASVAHYGYAQNGLQAPGAYSPSWFKKERRIDQQSVLPADVALVYFPSKGRYAHTIAAVEKPVRSAGRIVQVTTLEGNTNAQGSREGDQFARRVRPADTLTFVRWWK